MIDDQQPLAAVGTQGVKRPRHLTHPGWVDAAPFRAWLAGILAREAGEEKDASTTEIVATRIGLGARAVNRVLSGESSSVEIGTVDRALTLADEGTRLDDLYPPDLAGVPTRLTKPVNRNNLLTEQGWLRVAELYYGPARLSYRQIADLLIAEGVHASRRVLAVSIADQFRRQGWKGRDRIEAVRERMTEHGRARRGMVDPAWKRERRIAQGLVHDVRCEGVKAGYPQKGRPCQRWALRGSRFCISHDPAWAERRNANLQRARMRRAA